MIQKVDAGGNVFTTAFDGLDRVKNTAGPAIVTVTSYQSGNPPSSPVIYVTNILQQIVTNFFDAAGRALTNVNALGETTVTTMDALGRPTSTKIYSSSGSLVREEYLAYSSDHNSVTVTDGSGATAISHTTWTDNDGHTVLAIAYPSSGVNEFTLNQFDLAGNLVSAQHDSSASGIITTWTTATLAYDGLNRLTSKSDRDNALTTYAYDPLNDLTNRIMPGGSLQWQATYNQAGQMLQERNVGGASATHTNTYAYFASGSPFAGLLHTKTDGRGVTCTYSYDDWLRVTTNAYAGSLAEQNLTTAWQYEPRGFVTQISEQFASTNTGPATSIQRTFDPYGQLSSESVSAGSFSYGASQSFDAAGRRSQLGIGGGGYGFGWQAGGNLISASDPSGRGAYSFDTAGILTSRTVDNRITSIASRDGEGRSLSITTTVNGVSQLTESLTWSGDGLLAAHTLARADFTDSRAYAYANLTRRLVQEQLNLNGSTTWTNTMVYDNGVPALPGVLTQMGQANSSFNEWNGVADAFSRVNTETNNTIAYAAYGHVNGQSTLSGFLDGQPVSITGVGTNAMQWRATMELTPGAHQLQVAALHPSGFYTAWATNAFTNNIAYQKTTNTFDGAGNITYRVWRNASGATNRTQTLSWDARGRLHQVIERGTNNSGYNWTAVYDALNRRVSTTTVLVTNGVAYTAPPTTINSYFDPQVEFLELGVSYGGQTVWKLYGPDLNGKYGGLNGTGGLDGVSPYLNLFDTTVSDARGNILGYYDPTKGSVQWTPARMTGYGAVPGYRPAALANGANIAQSSAWRGHWVDITGYYQIGARTYDPFAGNWLSFDPIWNERDPNGYSFCSGDPVNGFDSDGRLDPNAPDEMDLWQQLDFQNQLYKGNPAAVKAMQQNEGNEAYFNGDATAYLQGQNDRAAQMAAVVLPTISVASVVSLPAGPEGEAITWNVIAGAIVRSGLVNATASSTVAYETGQPVTPAFEGGFVAGAVTGPAGAYAQTLSPFASFAVNSTFGFAGNFAGNATSQVYQNGGLNNYNLNQSLYYGILGAVLNPGEANVSASAEGFFPSTVTQTPLFKAGQVSLDYTIGVGDSAFGSFVEPTSQNSASQQNNGAYTPGPLGGKH